ncbi:Lar family restriction alleviation protein [Clostridiaceae bacterium NSJ-31]|uniref:Lar family restriction alleviation protein n=1 Tax=Ligaoa zhengdingensis TaxID=2763658 RepID=A0A926I4P9_9FIRM|nr:Lar family restriction alleviation protein [Ligaoa zhengdingensis]MBC8546471.1 Lar family restriction alleviation protein [Ligaoa zhengdingensis]
MKKSKKVKKREKKNRPKLKPCPFCGGEAVIEDAVYNYAVMCTRCRCETRWETNEGIAIDLWNRRSTMDELKPCP